MQRIGILRGAVCAAALWTLLLAAVPGYAAELTAGTHTNLTGAPMPPVPLNIVQEDTISFNVPADPGSTAQIYGTVYRWVVQDTSDNTLTFYWQVHNASEPGGGSIALFRLGGRK